MKTVAIVQSNYIPWKGYFDLMAAVDEFMIYDEVQYTRRDWRNRNKIKTPHGLLWLSIPVKVKGKYHQRIRDTEIADDNWAKEHCRTLKQYYCHSDYFGEIMAWLAPLYYETSSNLSELNRRFIEAIACYLGIGTNITDCWDYTFVEGKTERLANLCQQAGATEYVSGPAARIYIDETVFARAGIKLTWFDYSNYPEYPQLWGPFEHRVSIIDLLFNCGPNAARYMRYVRS